jgi:hypothetical protein
MYVNAAGYRVLSGKRYEHVVVAEKALGKPLPKGAVVHHVNGDRLDNRPENLVIFENNVEHMLAHAKQRIQAAGGEWDKDRICSCCKECLPKDSFSFNKRNWDGRHDVCRACTNRRRRGKGYSMSRRKRLQQ